jgi:hypothetical protein
MKIWLAATAAASTLALAPVANALPEGAPSPSMAFGPWTVQVVDENSPPVPLDVSSVQVGDRVELKMTYPETGNVYQLRWLNVGPWQRDQLPEVPKYDRWPTGHKVAGWQVIAPAGSYVVKCDDGREVRPNVERWLTALPEPDGRSMLILNSTYYDEVNPNACESDPANAVRPVSQLTQATKVV